MYRLFRPSGEDVVLPRDHAGTPVTHQYHYTLHIIGNNPLNKKIMQDRLSFGGRPKYPQ